MAAPPVTPWWDRTLTSDGQCSYSRSESSSCKTTFDAEAGEKPVRRCERIRTLLRHCPGKPTEVVESTSEVTEEEETSIQRLPGLPSLPVLPSLPSFLPRAPEGPSGEERVDSFFKDIFKATEDMLGQLETKLEESASEALKGFFPPEEGAAGGNGAGGDAERLRGWKKFLGLETDGGEKRESPAAGPRRSGDAVRKDGDQYKSFEQKFEEV